MTRDEAARLLAALSTGWPHVEMTTDRAETWFLSALDRIPFDVGLAVVTRIVETEERFPTVARFHEIRRAVERRNSENDEPRQLLAGVLPRGESHRWAKIARLVNAETPGWGTLEHPRNGGERAHHRGENPDLCGFCRERFELTDAELDERLRGTA